MTMEEDGTAYEWQFDDFGIDVTADDDDTSMDIESLMRILNERQPDDSVQNGLVDPVVSIAPPSESSSSVGVNEHIGTHNGDFIGSFTFSPSDQSGASTSGTVCSVSSTEPERQMVNPGFSKPVYQPDVSSMNYSSTSLGDWAMPVQRYDNSNIGFSEQDGNHQLIDSYGMTNGVYDSVADSYRKSEASDIVESPFLDVSRYSDIVYDPHDEILFPYLMTENCHPDSQFTDQSFLQSDASIKKQLMYMKDIEYPHYNMQLLPQKIQHNGVPSTTYYNDDDPDICILEDMSEPAPKKQTSIHWKPVVTAQRLSIGVPSTQMGSNHMRPKANDERFIYQAALQDLSQPKSEATPPGGALTIPLLRHQRIALSWMIQKETKNFRCFGGILADDQGLGKTISTIALILKERPPSSNVGTIETKAEVTETLNLDDDDESITNFNKCEQNMKTNGSLIDQKITPVQTRIRPSAGTLVVCPTSVLRQWNDELHNKVSSESNLSVLVYHGGNRTKDPFELAKYDVVLTTYAIVSMEVPKQPLADEEDDEMKKGKDFHPMGTKKRKYPPTSKKGVKKEIDNELFESLARPLAKVRWFRVVLDEAQSIKNHKTQVARACWGLRAKRRWCLSGTPIQNAIDDLYSYFRFLRYEPYSVYKSFCSTIKIPIQRNPVIGYKKLQAVLKTIMLRRTKCTLLDGEPIISLPPKTVNLEKIDFTAEEREFYCRLEAESRAQFEEYAAAGTVKQNYVNILLMLLRLRQACDHPLLVRGCSSSSEWMSSIEKAKKFTPEKRSRLLNCLEASLAICSICNDAPEDAVVTTCEHVFCNQCILEQLSSDDCHCPSSKCKALLSKSSIFTKSTLGLSIGDHPDPGNILDSSGLVKPESLELCSSNGNGIINSSRNTLTFSGLVKPEPLELCSSNGNGIINSSGLVKPEFLELYSSNGNGIINSSRNTLNSSGLVKPEHLELCSSNGNGILNSSGNTLSSSGLVRPETLELCSSIGILNSSKIDAAKALESSKIKAAIGVLQSISKPREIKMDAGSLSIHDHDGSPEKASKDTLETIIVREKAIVFSQWTRMLDLLEACLKDSSISYRRLDGTMSVVARDKAVKDFKSLPEVTVMIMSLKAASLGLNMVDACHVVLLDLWWNPTTEDQAVDRAHRIGQTRPVTVLRLTVRNTVEDRILALQQKKREMVSSAFGEDETGSRQTRLTVDDLKYLFQA